MTALRVTAPQPAAAQTARAVTVAEPPMHASPGEEQPTVASWVEHDYFRWYRQVRELRSVYRKRQQYEIFYPGQMDLPRGIAVLKVVVK